jgi:AcrR family transcriptional regulator
MTTGKPDHGLNHVGSNGSNGSNGDATTVRTTRAELAAATKQRIVSGAHHLLREKRYEEVTLAAIAAAAEVSHQTVLNHFESKDRVILTVLDSLWRETIPMLSRTQRGDVRGAVKALVGRYERMGDILVGWLSSGPHSQELEQARWEGIEQHQDWLEEMFADFLPSDGAARRRMTTGLKAATYVMVWKLLRRDLHRSRASTEQVILDLVFGVLDSDHEHVNHTD